MKPGKERTYYPALDGIRAICVILTLVAHARYQPGFINGTVGVDIFFALSGYLITMLLLQEKERTGRISIAAFYIRRIFRIVPLYYLTILLYLPATAAAAFALNDWQGLNDWKASLPWLLTFNSELRTADAGNLFGHAWTLGIEEKFYLLWPLVFVPIVAWGRKALVLVPLLLVFLPSQLMFRGYTGIVAGVVVALLVEQGHWREMIRKVPTALWLLPVGAGFLATYADRETEHLNVLVSIPAAFLISSLVHNREGMVSRALAAAPLPFLGRLTYAMYLLHRLSGHVVEVAMDKLRIQSFVLEYALVYGLTVLAAWALYHTVEKPMIKLGRRVASARRKDETATA